MRLSRRVVLVLLAACALACQGDDLTIPTEPPPPPPPGPPPPGTQPQYRIVGDQFWAGSPVHVRMSGPGARPFGAVLSMRAVAVSLERTDDSTLSGTIPPEIEGGLIEPTVGFNNFTSALAPVVVFGRSHEASYATDYASGALFPVPYPPTGSGAVMIASRFGLIRLGLFGNEEYHPSVNALQMTSPGPTADPDIWLFRSALNGQLERWRLSPTPTFLESLPWVGSGAGRTYAELGAGRLLAFEDDHGAVLHREGDSYTPQFEFLLHGFKRVSISPRGDRAAITGNTGLLQWEGTNPVRAIPVFAMPSGMVAFGVLDLNAISVVAFSPSGDTLALAGGFLWHTANELRLVDATTGFRIGGLTPGGAIRGVTYDTQRALLYVATVGGGTLGLTVRVYSTATLAKVGEMRTSCRFGCQRDILLVSGGDNLLHSVELGVEQGGIGVVTYLLPPPDVPAGP
jgi:hypothetical protein